MGCAALTAPAALPNQSRASRSSDNAHVSPSLQSAGSAAPVAENANLASVACPIKQCPRELVHIMARVAPFGVLALVRADRTLWSRFADDPLVWIDAVMRLQCTPRGRECVRSASALLLARFPVFSRFLPRRIAEDAGIFDLSPDGRLIACTFLRAVQILDAATDRELVAFVITDVVHQLCFSPSCSLLACRGSQWCIFSPSRAPRESSPHRGSIWLYDCTSWTLSRMLPMPGVYARAMAFLADDAVACGAHDGSISLWDARSATTPYRVLRGRDGGVYAMAASLDLLALGSLLSPRTASDV